MQERLQKILARAGFGSRRSCEELISAGRVTVNGKVAVLGDKADPLTDQLAVDLVPLPAAEKLVYVALHKPRHVLSAVSTPDGRRTVRDLVDLPERIYPVGRLDFESEGLVLLTNDGELANRLSHPRYGHEKEYHVLVARRPDAEQLETWRRGVVLEDGYKTAPARVTILETASKGVWLEVVLKEGRKRQIREVGNRIGLPVLRIIRTRIGSLKLGKLKLGEWRHLTRSEVESLQHQPAVARPKTRRDVNPRHSARPTGKSRK
jgi:23S rRNA pseudouridine2605 synthase